MIASDRQKFIEIVLGFAELKGKQLSAPALELYWRAMQGWSIEEFQEAAEELLRTCEFMPMPKDFEDLRKAGRETAGEAFASVRRYLCWGLNGYTLDAHCPPLIAKAVRAIGGPNVIAMCDEEKLHFLERRFCEHYETMQDSQDARDAVPMLTLGLSDRPRIAGSFAAIGRDQPKEPA